MKPADRSRIKNRLGLVFLVLWGVASTVVIGFQMVRHSVSMPLPAEVDRFVSEMASENSDGNERLINVNVVYENCSCTNALLKHLADRGPAADSREMVLVVGQHIPFESELRSAGYRITKMARPEFVERFGIEAAPLLAVIDHTRRLRYLGGYFKTSAAVRPLDLEILDQVRAGQEVPALPLYGCAISQRLRKYLDPLGLEDG